MKCVITVCTLVLFSGLATVALAEPANGFGRAGRSIVSGGASGFYSNVSRRDGFFHDDTWGAGVSASFRHFVVDNWAFGASAHASVVHLDDALHTKPSWSSAGGSLLALYHVPLHRRLSLVFQAGLYAVWYRDRDVVDISDFPTVDPPEDHESVVVGGSFHPQLLLHLSPSLAMGFGPGLTIGSPVQGERGLRGGFSVGPTLTYSLGTADADETLLEDARRFGARGRRIVSVGSRLDERASTSFSYARFVRQGLAVGGYGRIGFVSDNSVGDTGFVGFGLSLWGDVPLSRSASLLVVPSIGYAWAGWSVGNSSDFYVSHEVQFELNCYASMHLTDGLLIGVGPTFASHIRFAGDLQQANHRYVEPGASTLLTASF